uniref:NADH-ubiquinone oxidoreductase chain 6 n=1 Tax=Paraplagusia bilineata TaxID=1148453 RepID=V9INN4_9PLEU|nr:NADH dehydrogenase subunit 6 [Paraplagusia bilineata]AFB71258.1 NADH dehydrogenase subunit 6 [Paraplagusia bilineata]
MTFIIYVTLLVMVAGFGAVASHPSPYFGSLSLVLVSAGACIILVGYGGTFLSLIMFLVYLGGMLVVFAYTTALAADSFSYTLDYPDVVSYWLVYMLGVVICYFKFSTMEVSKGWVLLENLEDFAVSEGDARGMATMYMDAGSLLMVSGWMLLLTLFAVLELTRGHSRGSLRVV